MLALKRAFVSLFIGLLVVPAATAEPNAFFQQDIADDAILFESELRIYAKDGLLSAKRWRNLGNKAFNLKHTGTAARAFARETQSKGADAGAWLRLTAALLVYVPPKPPKAVKKILPKNLSPKWLKRRNAGPAAFIAYKKATKDSDRADALALLGQVLEQRHRWRPALAAYAQSQKLRPDASVLKLYAALRSKHGFRILKHTVSSDSATPQVCVQFSEKLPKHETDLSKFIVVDGRDPEAISIKKRELCIDGFKHGERHEIVLRTGLPSDKYESLEKTVDLKIYVGDRSASIRFSGRNYVLPKSGQAGIPLTSINVDKAEVTIYRLGDRSLTRTVLDEDFTRQITNWTVEKIENERGEKVWSGSLSVKRRHNKEVITAFPIGKAIKTLDAGVYVMVAKSSDVKGSDWHPLATQWFIVSDIGITSYTGDDGIHGFFRSLETALPLAGISVKLLARNNELLGTATTDDTGYVNFAPGLARGEGGLAPTLLVASSDAAGYAFLNLKNPGFDLSDRGVSGTKPSGPVNAFLYTERGIYRPGATVHITALLRDQQAKSLKLPLILTITRPDGVEYKRLVTKDMGLGGRTRSLTLEPSVMTGTWSINAYVDEKADPLTTQSFLVEDFVPDKLKMVLTPTAEKVRPDSTPFIDVTGEFLYGAPASGLKLQGESIVTARSSSIKGFKGYVFGDTDEQVSPERKDLESLPDTGKDGKTQVAVTLPDLPQSTKPLMAKVSLRLLEPSGRGIERQVKFDILPKKTLIGIKPLFEDGSVGEGETAGFEVAAMGRDGTQIAVPNMRWELSKLETRYQWYRYDGRWKYEKLTSTKRIADGKIDLLENAPLRIESPVEWGRYRLEVFNGTESGDIASGPFARMNFDAGWYSASGTSDTPSILDTALDKDTYLSGETAALRVTARSAGRLHLAIMNSRLIESRTVEVHKGANSIALPIGADWGPGAYIAATLYRPMNIAAKKMPTRSIGIEWISVDRAKRTIGIALNAPKKIRPEGDLLVPVKLSGLEPGEEAYIVAAAVDAGILSLTRYKAPAPEDRFYGKQKLGMVMRDLYGKLIDGMQGVAGTIRSGGDGGLEISGSPPVEKPLSVFSGLVKVRADGTADLRFDIPAFTGTVRVMAVAWSKSRVGHNQADVFVRDKLVLSGTTPRFMARGDVSNLHLTFDNVEGPAGIYSVEVDGKGLRSIPSMPKTFKLDLAAKERKSILVPIRATQTGTGAISASITGPLGQIKFARSFEVPVRSPFPTSTNRQVQSIASSGSLLLSKDIFTGLVPGTGKITLAVGPRMMGDMPSMLEALDRYPYRCSEQITSRTLPLLYLSSMSEKLGGKPRKEQKTVAARVEKAITRLLSRQDTDGSFGLWRSGGHDLWLNAYVTDFLTRAREKGYKVPATAYGQALDQLYNAVGYANDFNDGGEDVAYALYVLARNKRARIGDLRYYADIKMKDFGTPLAQTHIAAALALYGDRARAKTVFDVAVSGLRNLVPEGHYTADYYGSALRDRAASITLISESGLQGLSTKDIEKALEDGAAAHGLSTQEKSWMLLAANSLMQEAEGYALELNGAPHAGPLTRTFTEAELGGAGFNLTNLGDDKVRAVMLISGEPEQAQPAKSQGFTLSRKFYDLNGKEVTDMSGLRQNTRLVVVLKAVQTTKKAGQVLVVDHLPAGFEIDNPKLVSSANPAAYANEVKNGTKPSHTGFRDDRFTAAFKLSGREKLDMVMAYMVRAVAPGSYILPPAIIEDMYRPELFARTGTGQVKVVK